MNLLWFLFIVSHPASSLFLEKFHPSLGDCTLTAEYLALRRVAEVSSTSLESVTHTVALFLFFFQYANTCCAVETPWLSFRPTPPSAFGQVLLLHSEWVKQRRHVTTAAAIGPKIESLFSLAAVLRASSKSFFLTFAFVTPFNSHERETLVEKKKSPQKHSGLCSANSLWEEPRVAERWLPSLVPPHP